MPDLVPHDGITGPNGERVLVSRSARRRRTVSITRRGGDLVVAVPASMRRREEAHWVRRMVETMARKEQRGAGRSDEELARRAEALRERYLPEAPAPRSVTWSSRQHTRWGSCTSAEGAIRISDRLRGMPEHVLDHVLLHELAHLVEGGHGPEFRRLAERHPDADRAQGFLDGVSWAEQHGARQPSCDAEGDEAHAAAVRPRSEPGPQPSQRSR